MVSIQNRYSLLCRQFDTDWAKLSVMEDMPLLAFLPPAVGLLSGKDAGDVTPDGTRRSATPTPRARIMPQMFKAVAAYPGMAARHGLDPRQKALAFCRSRPVPVIPIPGAATTAQLAATLGAAGLVLSDEVQAEIAAAHRAFPAPF